MSCVGIATQHVAGLLRVYIVVVCQGVASHESQSQSCTQGLSSSAAEAAPQLMQGMEQAMDVQVAGRAVRSTTPRTNVWPTGLRSK